MCDGYREVTVTQTIKKDTYDNLNQRIAYSDTYTKSSTKKYLHMNWGWGHYYQNGNNGNDGWCTYDYWAVNNSDGTIDNYQYLQEMITIKP